MVSDAAHHDKIYRLKQAILLALFLYSFLRIFYDEPELQVHHNRHNTSYRA